MTDTSALTAVEAAFGGTTPDQICFLVEDIEAAVQAWSKIAGYEEWRVYTYDRAFIPNMEYYGEPGQYSMRLALSGSNPQIELIQPIDGPSIYHDWIETRGYGLHHVGFFVSSVASVRAEMERRGFPTIAAGSGYGLDGDGGFAYYDLMDTPYKVVAEAIEVPARRRPAEEL